MTLLAWLLLPPAVISFTLWLYQSCIALWGFGPVRSYPAARRFRRFAVLVPAHNEENVIHDVLASLAAQSYPRECFDVFVAADHCTDKTVEVSLRHGATVLERTNGGGGKAGNIRFALEQIDLDAYDAVAFFDADNLVDRQFLSRMNDTLEAERTADAVQGFLDVKNPHDSWLTIASTMTYLYTNRFWQLARARAGLSAHLGGTGSVIRATALQRHGWNTESLTEDLEFTVKLILEGKRVFWNHEAVIYDEKPVSYGSALRQRQRWTQGQFWNLFRHVGPLFRAWVKGGAGPSRLQCFDTLLNLLIPGQMLISYLCLASLLLYSAAVGFVGWIWAAPMLVLFYTFLMQAIAAPSLHHGRLVLTYTFYFLHLQAMILLVVPAHLLGALHWRNQGTWVKTEHVRPLGPPSQG